MLKLIESLLSTHPPSSNQSSLHISCSHPILQSFSTVFSTHTTNILPIIAQIVTNLVEKRNKMGPNSFNQLLSQLCTDLHININAKIIQGQQMTSILIITYFEREFSKILDFEAELGQSVFCWEQKIMLQCFNIIALLHIRMAPLFQQQTSAQNSQWTASAHEKTGILSDKMQKYREKLKNLNFDLDKQVSDFLSELTVCSRLLRGISYYFIEDFKYARKYLLDVLDSIANQQYPNSPKYFPKRQITICCLIYLYKTACSLNKQQLAHYYITKAYQQLKKMGERAVNFISSLEEHFQFKKQCVKLERIETKFERQTAHTIHKFSQAKMGHKERSQSINISKKINHKERMSVELQKILTIENKKSTFFKFRKENINYLMRQQRSIRELLRKNREEIKAIEKKDAQLLEKYSINELKTQIAQLSAIQSGIDQDYQALKYENMAILKPIPKINLYFRNFIQLKQYKRKHILYEFVYGKTISKTVCVVFMLLMRKKISKQKKVVAYSKIYYNNLLHFVQIYERLPTALFNSDGKLPGFYMKIYPIGIVDQSIFPKQIPLQTQIEISFEQAFRMKDEPFYYSYSMLTNNKSQSKAQLVPWNTYIKSLSFGVIYSIQKFIRKIKGTLHKNQNVVYLKKREISLRFSGNDSFLSHTFLVKISKLSVSQQSGDDLQQSISNKEYLIELYTISNNIYHNQLYNIRINKQWKSENSTLEDDQLYQIYLSELYGNFSQSIIKITTIQKICRMAFSKKVFQKLRKNAGCIIRVIVHHNIIYTFRKEKSNKAYLIIQNIKNKEVQVKESQIDQESFKMIDLIRDRLQQESSCRKKMRIIINFIKIKSFIKKIKENLKKINKKTSFQRSFENRLIFHQKFDSYIYRNTKIHQKIMFTLIVKSLIDFPRPYRLRVFTFEKSSNPIDIQMIIFNEEQALLVKAVSRLNSITNIISKSKIILPTSQNELASLPKMLRRNSRYSCSSFGSSNQINSHEAIPSQNTIPKIPDSPKESKIRNQNKENTIQSHLIIVKRNPHRSSAINRFKNTKKLSIQQRSSLVGIKSKMSELILNHTQNSDDE